MSDLISVIVPVYNVEKYLNRCFESIIEQTYTNLEIILVDDGSTDGSGKLCDELKKKDDRVCVIHQKNGGLSAARNSGMRIARGEYFCFIDSDDYVDKHFVEILYNACKDYSSKITMCRYRVVGDDKPEELSYDNIQYNKYDRHKALEGYYTGKFAETVVAWNKLYHKSLFENVLYPEGRINEDAATTYKLIYLSGSIVDADVALYNYYVREGSIMHSGWSLKKLDDLQASEEKLEFYKTHGEKELYSMEQEFYCKQLLHHYCLIPNSKEYKDSKKDILQKYRKTFKQLNYDNNLHGGLKHAENMIYSVCPKMYKLLRKVRGLK